MDLLWILGHLVHHSLLYVSVFSCPGPPVAGSVLNAVRSLVPINVISKQETTNLGIFDFRFRHIMDII